MVFAKLLQTNDIILIQEHWLFQAQIHLISESHGEINYVGKGVDINDPSLPVSMPRGYGGVAVQFGELVVVCVLWVIEVLYDLGFVGVLHMMELHVHH
jgi:hypothetical protein